MVQVAKLIGGAGTGKTAELLNTMQHTVKKLDDDPMRVGFVSFTRAARREAASRAADQFNVPLYQLEQQGWFRTLHSTCKKILGVGNELVADNKESREWIENAIQEPIGSVGREPDGFYTETVDTVQDAARALHLWDTARNRLGLLKDAWKEVDRGGARVPHLAYCQKIVEEYEQAKRLDHRPDFTDLLSRFSGYRFDAEYGVERCEPCGDPPELETWFFDEQQDTSALLDAVCRRLIQTDTCKWVYLAGDPFQSIYGWNGASPRWFVDWKADKTRVMPRSYRCAAPILQVGEQILKGCSDYFDRRISPAEHDGTVEHARKLGNLTLDPSVDWLILARTNFLAGQLAKHLDREGFPWVSTRGNNRWTATVRNEVIRTLRDVQAGAPIDGGQWQAVLKYLPATTVDCPVATSADRPARESFQNQLSRIGGGKIRLLAHGTKSRFAALDNAQGEYPWVMPADLSELGATDELIRAIREGRWLQWIEGAADYLQAAERFGEFSVANPQIKLGTIHSAKGAEADNVALLTQTSGPCARGAESEEGSDEQRRVFYVGATRARRRLVILNDARSRYRFEGMG